MELMQRRRSLGQTPRFTVTQGLRVVGSLTYTKPQLVGEWVVWWVVDELQRLEWELASTYLRVWGHTGGNRLWSSTWW